MGARPISLNVTTSGDQMHLSQGTQKQSAQNQSAHALLDPSGTSPSSLIPKSPTKALCDHILLIILNPP
jgi:hypothetical protein